MENYHGKIENLLDALDTFLDKERLSLNYPISCNEMMKRAGIDGIKALLRSNDADLPNVPKCTGMDKIASHMQNSDLVFVASPHHLGKPNLALNFAVNTTINHKMPVLFFTNSIGVDWLIGRLIAHMSMVDVARISPPSHLTDDNRSSIAAALLAIADMPLYFDYDKNDLTISEMAEKCRNIKQESGLGLVMIDYFQLIDSEDLLIDYLQSGKYHEAVDIDALYTDEGDFINEEFSRIEETEKARALKSLAVELDCPVIATVSTFVYKKDRTIRPKLADLREIGDIEQFADFIGFLYTDDEFNLFCSDDEGVVELIVAKHRNKVADIEKLHFQGKYARFENISHSKEEYSHV